MTTKFRTTLAALLAGIALASPARAELRIVATTTDLGDLARAVGGKHVDVDAICKGEQDPHYAQARPSYMVRLSRADLLISVGLDLEVAWLPPLIRGARNPRINPGKLGHLDASTAIAPIDVRGSNVDRRGGDLHPRGNPHYWLDPKNATPIARAIAARLKKLDPDQAADYDRNLAAFVKRVDMAIPRWNARMAPHRGRPIVSYHATFNYFIKHFGLSPRGFVESKPGLPPAPAHLASLIGQMRKDHVSVILHERYHDESASQLVARRTGAQVVKLPTSVGGERGTGDYIKLMDHLVERTAAALGGN